VTAIDDQPAAGSGWVEAVGKRLAGARHRCLGFPVATDIDFTDLAPLHAGFINNIGDPEAAGRWRCHTKDIEREVISTFLGLFGGSALRSWGYVTGGGATEGVTHGMWLGLERHPAARVYHSAAAHYCIPKAARLLRAPTTVIPTDPCGEIRYDALTATAHQHRDRPALVVATAGTTMTEAVDDLASIHTALTTAGITDRFVVVDAALAGPALALAGGPAASWLAEHGGRHRADADSICFSSHKSFGTPHVSGVSLTRRRHLGQLGRPVDYLASVDTSTPPSAGRAPGTPPSNSTTPCTSSASTGSAPGPAPRGGSPRTPSTGSPRSAGPPGDTRTPGPWSCPNRPPGWPTAGNWPPAAGPATSCAPPASPPRSSTNSPPNSPPPWPTPPHAGQPMRTGSESATSPPPTTPAST
jgi:Pyridoxal-dependent decarboxylase conserved domain